MVVVKGEVAVHEHNRKQSCVNGTKSDQAFILVLVLLALSHSSQFFPRLFKYFMAAKLSHR